MKVRNMTGNSGNPVHNQFILEGVPAGQFNREGEHIPSGDTFQSYQSIIAHLDCHGQLWLDADTWDYSRTTARYRNKFTGLTTKETQAGIKDGSIRLVHFNS